MMKDKYKLMKNLDFPMIDWDMYAYNRLDFCSGKWYNKWFPVAGTNGNTKISSEMQAFSDFMTDNVLPNGHRDIALLVEKLSLEDKDMDGNHDYIAFCEGENVNIKILLTDREKDYHLRIFFYPKKN